MKSSSISKPSSSKNFKAPSVYVSTSTATLETETVEFLVWLEDNVFKPTSAAAKKKLVNVENIINLWVSSQAKDPVIKGTRPSGRRYNSYRRGRYAELRKATRQLDILKENKYLLKSFYDYYSDGRVYYVSCILPGETLKAHKERHKQLFKDKVARREVIIKTNVIVLKDNSVKTLEGEIAAAKKSRAIANRTLNQQLVALVRSLKKQVDDDIGSLDDVWKGQAAVRIAIEGARKDIKAAETTVALKKQELILLKQKLKKPVRGLVKNPQAMNL